MVKAEPLQPSPPNPGRISTVSRVGLPSEFSESHERELLELGLRAKAVHDKLAALGAV